MSSAEVPELTVSGKDRAAQIISHLGSPPVLGTLYFLWLAAADGPLSYDAISVSWGLMVLVPSLILLVLAASRRVSDADLSRLEERRRILPITLPFGVAAFAAALLLHFPPAVQASVAAMVLLSVAGTTISQFWKVSLHVTGAVAIFWLCIAAFGLAGIAAVWIPPLVAWSRLQLHQHDGWQVAGGTLVGTLCTLAAVYPFLH